MRSKIEVKSILDTWNSTSMDMIIYGGKAESVECYFCTLDLFLIRI